MLKDNFPLGPVPVAEFKIENLELVKVAENLGKYFKRMPTHVRVSADRSWRSLLGRLEVLPRIQHTFPKMNLSDLPKTLDNPVVFEIPDEFNFVEDKSDNFKEIVGQVYPEGLFNHHIKKDMDVAVRSEDKSSIPWLGRVVEILSDCKFLIHWYGRSGRSLKFRALLKENCLPSTTVIENNMVMMWDISTSKTENSFFLTPGMLNNIMDEYASYDLS